MINALCVDDMEMSSKPWWHCIFDGVCVPRELAAAAAELGAMPLADWNRDDHHAQVGKFWLPSMERMPPATAQIMRFLQGERFVTALRSLSDLADLQPDPDLLGGGVHCTVRGGRLEVHADFNRHPNDLRLYRRVNVLLFLNREWRREWGGALELWSHDMSKCERKILPTFNRMVVLGITKTAYHGHPHPLECPQDVRRLSLATYYYSREPAPGEGEDEFHWAAWQERKNA